MKLLKDSMRWLPGAVVSLGVIAAILYFVDFRKMAAAISHANYWLLAAATALSFLWMAVRAIVWRTLLRDRAPYKEVFFTLGKVTCSTTSCLSASARSGAPFCSAARPTCNSSRSCPPS